MSLSAGDKTFSEIVEHFSKLSRRFGYFALAEEQEEFVQAVREDVELLRNNGLVTEKGGVYSITAEGREKASHYLGLVARISRIVDRALLPETVSIAGVGVHFALAALKLGAGMISGSIGLISDGTDTLLDGLSSILVYLGLKYDKEKYVNVVLIVLMLGVGFALVMQVIRRFLQPFQPEVDLLSFAAALTSGAVCFLLGQYQQYVGVRSGSISLISQSVDSRNHVIVAVGVSAGLAAAVLNFGLLDAVVGLGVAILIIKSALELAVETIRVLQGEMVDFSKYEPAVIGKYRETKERQLREWILYLIYSEGPVNRGQVRELASEALNFGEVPVLRELGMHTDGNPDVRVENALSTLRADGLISGSDPMTITSTGKTRTQEMLQKRQHTFWRGHTRS
jgi:hypothetical protein